MKIYNNITETIGNTPLVKLSRISGALNANIYAKLEFYNPTSSVKDRIAVNMIDVAEQEGLLKKGGVIIEPTSGNTGLGLAMVASARGYKLIITMPESMSIERRAILKHFGAELVLTPASEGMKGAIDNATYLTNTTPNSFMPQQFNNLANPEAHRKTTAIEILNDTDGNVDFVIAGVGTGGTITGIAQVLKEKIKDIQIVAVEPETSAVISGEPAGKHTLQGIGAGFIPEVFEKSLIDIVSKVSEEDAYENAKLVATQEGILCGISSGAALATAIELAKKPENKNKNIVVIFPDTGERYLSTILFS